VKGKNLFKFQEGIYSTVKEKYIKKIKYVFQILFNFDMFEIAKNAIMYLMKLP